MAYFDQLDKCSFNGIAFPVERVRIACGLRRHVHQYSHAPAGASEKLGRRNYVFEIESTFDENWNRRYPGLYPDNLERLFKMWEEETTSGLILPTLGKVDAYCVNWAKDMEFSIRSGEKVHLEFEEDQSQLYVIDAMLATAASSLSALQGDFLQQLTAAELGDPKPSIFDKINNAITQVLAARDQGEIISSLVESKALAVVALCAEADKTVEQLQDPMNEPLLNALKEAWAAAQSLALDIAQQGNPIKTYTTPRRMAITDVSAAIYGTTERALEILQLNDVADAVNIQANTPLKYYEAAA